MLLRFRGPVIALFVRPLRLGVRPIAARYLSASCREPPMPKLTRKLPQNVCFDTRSQVAAGPSSASLSLGLGIVSHSGGPVCPLNAEA
jgi:hypothetical protein